MYLGVMSLPMDDTHTAYYLSAITLLLVHKGFGLILLQSEGMWVALVYTQGANWAQISDQ